MPDRPNADERAWLLARLAELVAEGGHEPLVAAPLIEASEAWFPDPCRPDAWGSSC